MLGSQQPVRARPTDDEGGALQPGLLAWRGVHYLRLEALALRPLQIHAHQHLDPVLRLDAALADGQRDDCIVVRIWIGEEEIQLSSTQLGRHGRAFLRHLRLQVGVALGELIQLDEVTRAALEPVPGGNQLAMLRRLARQLTCARGVVPDAGLG